MSNFDNLPPEMQQRIQNMIATANPNGAPQQQQQPQPAPKPAAPPKPPSLMDHTIAARQEIAAARQEIAALQQQMQAMGQVIDAVGNAVGQLYGMFHEQSTPTTYSEDFQAAPPSPVDDTDY